MSSSNSTMSNTNGVSNNGFTLEALKSILAKSDTDQHGAAAGASSSPSQEDKQRHRQRTAIQQFYQTHGIVAPISGLRRRPIPVDLYRCPLSEPLTTLEVHDDPHHQHGDGDHNGIVVVEVMKQRQEQQLQQQQDGQEPGRSSTTSTTKRRPLNGNLTNKLTEYTRGQTGRMAPFTPGGMDLQELNKDPAGGGGRGAAAAAAGTKQTPVDDDLNSLSQDLLKQSLLSVLHMTTNEAWKAGKLLTAPPGVDFECGLSYKDVFGTEDSMVEDDNNKNNDEDTAMSTNLDHPPDDDETSSTTRTKVGEGFMGGHHRLAPTVRWDKSFLDDDSLFGSSVGSSSDEDEDDNENDDETTHNIEESTNVGPDPETINDLAQPESQSSILRESQEPVTGSDEEIDGLLKELSRADARANRQVYPSNSDNDAKEIIINPLKLAEEQAALQDDSKRKTWASKDLLPIDDFHALIPNPPISYPFTLDGFQQQAVSRLERNENVFVAAHTSAGKTVVAEYAIALARQRGTRCIYTSPIKALSNQKFRDFCLKFGSENVGIVTGDLQINVDDSTVLIMTTEILRSMLYRGADLIRDIESVVFDEVHYINDTERGVVWEEVIIMLPAYVNLIFLSATTPNTFEFSDWIGRTKRKPVYVVKTNYRPVPLSHYLWANLKLHKVKEGNGSFKDKGYQEASNALKPKDDKKDKGKKVVPTSSGRGPSHMAWQAQGSKAQWMSLIRFLERETLTPTVVFSFSKKKCEEIANMLRSLDLNTAAERSAVQGFALQTVARLSPNDAVLPQVMTICEMVKRGIGVHHGGLLPILKEMVEILFSRGLVKVLFATETFAMGVNMPARSVVFNSIRKHDGLEFRVLQPGEYTQMAGRAGRRGLDKVGTVIMCCFGEQPPPIGILRNMLTGSSTMLRSQFRLTYNMILNLLRVEEMSVESMIKRSFSEFATQRALTANEYPKLLARGEKTLSKLESEFSSNRELRVGAEDVEEYFVTSSQLLSLNEDLLNTMADSADGPALSVLEPGRLILVNAAREYGLVRAPAIVLATQGLSSNVGGSSAEGSKASQISLDCMVLLPETYVHGESKLSNTKPLKGLGEVGEAHQRHFGIYQIRLDNVLLVTTKKKKIEPLLLYCSTESLSNPGGPLRGQDRGVSPAFGGAQALPRNSIDDAFAGFKARGKKKDADESYGAKKKKDETSSQIQAIESSIDFLIEAEKDEMSTGLSALDMREHLTRGNDVIELRKVAVTLDELVMVLRTFQSHRHPSLEKYYSQLERIHLLRSRVDSLSHLLSNESLQLFPDFLTKKEVLKTLGYIDANESVAVKGRVACEVNTCDELIITEILFEGLLNDLGPAEIVAALSALIYQQKSDDDDFGLEIPEDLLHCCERMKTVARNLGRLQKEHGLETDPDEYLESSMKFGLVHVVYEWAIGVPFRDICELTTAQEGSIVRCITRLDELCREVRNASRVMGNPTLYRKMETASTAIKRDIVFAASLYVS